MSDDREDSRWENQVHKLEGINKILQARNEQLAELLRNRDDVQTAVRKIMTSKDFLRSVHDLFYGDTHAGQSPDAPAFKAYVDTTTATAEALLRSGGRPCVLISSAEEQAETAAQRALSKFYESDGAGGYTENDPATLRAYRAAIDARLAKERAEDNWDVITELPGEADRAATNMEMEREEIIKECDERSVGMVIYDEVQQDMSDEDYERLKSVIPSCKKSTAALPKECGSVYRFSDGRPWCECELKSGHSGKHHGSTIHSTYDWADGEFIPWEKAEADNQAFQKYLIKNGLATTAQYEMWQREEADKITYRKFAVAEKPGEFHDLDCESACTNTGDTPAESLQLSNIEPDLDKRLTPEFVKEYFGMPADTTIKGQGTIDARQQAIAMGLPVGRSWAQIALDQDLLDNCVKTPAFRPDSQLVDPKLTIGIDMGTGSSYTETVIVDRDGNVVETTRKGDELFIKHPDGTRLLIGTVVANNLTKEGEDE